MSDEGFAVIFMLLPYLPMLVGLGLIMIGVAIVGATTGTGLIGLGAGILLAGVGGTVSGTFPVGPKTITVAGTVGGVLILVGMFFL